MFNAFAMGLRKRKRDKSAKACRNTSWKFSETTGSKKVAVAPENSIVIVEPFFGEIIVVKKKTANP